MKLKENRMVTISLKMKIGIVEYDFNEIIDEWIKDDCREEARDILNRMLKWDTRYTYTLLVEFIIYHEKGMGNQVCQHLDFMKSRLVDFGHMKPGGCFGSPFIDLEKGI
jgi:hypothetical protein